MATYIEQRTQYWDSLRLLRSEYMDEHAAQVIYMDPRPSLHAWAEQKYGLRMGMDPAGNYTADYTVSDARRFMLYQMKFMK